LNIQIPERLGIRRRAGRVSRVDGQQRAVLPRVLGVKIVSLFLLRQLSTRVCPGGRFGPRFSCEKRTKVSPPLIAFQAVYGRRLTGVVAANP